VAEGARLESVYRGNSIAGSNPALSARNVSTGSVKQSKGWAKPIPLINGF
jgi:hypothetical protein